MILKLFWKLIYGARKLNLRVYRVIENRDGIDVISLVYENIDLNRFVEKASFVDQEASEAPNIRDLSDAWNAINGLKDIAFLMDSKTWQRLGAESIDEAINKANVHLGELYEMRKRFGGPSAPSAKEGRGTLRARARTKENAVELTPLAERVNELSRELGNAVGQENPSWEPIESTPRGRHCQILLIDGRGKHQVP